MILWFIFGFAMFMLGALVISFLIDNIPAFIKKYGNWKKNKNTYEIKYDQMAFDKLWEDGVVKEANFLVENAKMQYHYNLVVNDDEETKQRFYSTLKKAKNADKKDDDYCVDVATNVCLTISNENLIRSEKVVRAPIPSNSAKKMAKIIRDYNNILAIKSALLSLNQLSPSAPLDKKRKIQTEKAVFEYFETKQIKDEKPEYDALLALLKTGMVDGGSINSK